MQRLYCLAGEISGDLHGAAVLRELKLLFEGEIEFAGRGGPEMAVVGGCGDWVERAGVMGVWDVLKQYSYFRRCFYETLAEIEKFQPQVLLLIDYPGFNLRLAKVVRERFPEIRIVQYVCPQVWAWKQSRIPKMARWLDQVICLFPFEVPILEKRDCPAVYCGHPLVDELEEKRETLTREEGLVGLFPGSRPREVERLFPVMLEAARKLRKKQGKDITFAVPAISDKLAMVMKEQLQEGEEEWLRIEVGTSHRLMQQATCGVMASGTATLEAACFGLPYCLVYRVAPLTWEIAKKVVKVSHIGIVNILAEREVVTEFLQGDLNSEALFTWLEEFLENRDKRDALSESVLSIASQLGEGGAHVRVAQEVQRQFNLQQ